MHTPKSWDDKSLLEDEPFLSTFFAQKLETTRRSDLRMLTANVVQQLKRTRGGVSGFQLIASKHDSNVTDRPLLPSPGLISLLFATMALIPS